LSVLFCPLSPPFASFGKFLSSLFRFSRVSSTPRPSFFFYSSFLMSQVLLIGLELARFRCPVCQNFSRLLPAPVPFGPPKHSSRWYLFRASFTAAFFFPPFFLAFRLCRAVFCLASVMRGSAPDLPPLSCFFFPVHNFFWSPYLRFQGELLAGPLRSPPYFWDLSSHAYRVKHPLSAKFLVHFPPKGHPLQPSLFSGKLTHMALDSPFSLSGNNVPEPPLPGPPGCTTHRSVFV